MDLNKKANDLIEAGKAWLKRITKEDRDWAIELAIRSGLPGTMDGDGPGDALRHIIGSAALARRSWIGPGGVLLGTVLSEYDGYQESMKKNGPAVARGRLWMDVRNNVIGVLLWVRHRNLKKVGAATIEMLEEGPDEGFVKWQRQGFPEGGMDSPSLIGGGEGTIKTGPGSGSSGSGGSSSKGGSKASWFSSPANDDFHDKQDWKDIVTEGIKQRVEAAESDGTTSVWFADEDERPQPDDEGGLNFPTTPEELRQLAIDLGFAFDEAPLLRLLFSEGLPKEVIWRELARQAPPSAVPMAVMLALSMPDTSQDTERALAEWLRNNMRGRLAEFLSKPEISDPPKERP